VNDAAAINFDTTSASDLYGQISTSQFVVSTAWYLHDVMAEPSKVGTKRIIQFGLYPIQFSQTVGDVIEVVVDAPTFLIAHDDLVQNAEDIALQTRLACFSRQCDR